MTAFSALPERSVVIFIAVAAFVFSVLAACVRARSATFGALFNSILICSVLALGVCWGAWHAGTAMAARLPESLHGEDFPLRIRITGLPEVREASFRFGRNAAAGSGGSAHDIRFTARVVSPTSSVLMGQTLDLSWYAVDQSSVNHFKSGSVWDMTLRLKMPRGSVNPHTFDYEAWLLQRGVAATGYVRDRDEKPQRVFAARGLGRLRELLRSVLIADSRQGPLMAALLLGDRSAVEPEIRAVLQETGTAHLLAISGLHVGMVAAIGLLLGHLLSRAMALYRPVSPTLLPALLALSFAGFYTLIAGAPLSARRALIMTAALLLAWYWRRRIGPATGFALALAAVLTLQPLAPLSAGFWLSFGAVAGLLLGYSGRIYAREEPETRHPFMSGALSVMHWLGRLVKSQVMIFICLLVPSALIFSGVSLSGLVINLIAIPWVGMLILPVLLIAGILISGSILAAGHAGAMSAPAALCLAYVDWQLQQLVTFLDYCNRQVEGWQPLWISGHLLAGLAFVAALLLILPRGFPGRILGGLLPAVVLFGWLMRDQPRLPVYPSKIQSKQVSVTVLDVGQGLSVAIRAGDQNLVFDTGADTPSGWSAGASIVAPYLRGEGVDDLDAVILSHGDRDHAGGLSGLLSAMPVAMGLAPGSLTRRFETDASVGNTIRRRCIAGEEVTLQELHIRILWPEAGGVSGEENDHSCVALFQWRGRRLLLTGDISQKVERKLVSRYTGIGPIDLLIAPHHGSRTSSSNALVQWALPRNVVFSAGYRHHFGHPHPDVVQRYASAGSQIYSTADMGAVRFEWSGEAGDPDIYLARCGGRFWYKDASQCKAWGM